MKSTNDFNLCGEIKTDAASGVKNYTLSISDHLIATLSVYGIPRILYVWDIEKKVQVTKVSLSFLESLGIHGVTLLPNGFLGVAFFSKDFSYNIMIVDIHDLEKPKKVIEIENILDDTHEMFSSLRMVSISDHEILCVDSCRKRACIVDVSQKVTTQLWNFKEKKNGMDVACFINNKFLCRLESQHNRMWSSWTWATLNDFDKMDTFISKIKLYNHFVTDRCFILNRAHQDYVLIVHEKKITLHDVNQVMDNVIQTYYINEDDFENLMYVSKNGLFISLFHGQLKIREFLPLEAFFKQKEQAFIHTIKNTNLLITTLVDHILSPYLFFKNPPEKQIECSVLVKHLQ